MRVAVEDLSVELSGNRVVSGVGLVADDGEIVGVVGPNGSGKSTLLRAVYRHLRPASGRVLVDGRDVWRLSPTAAARDTAALPQERPTDFDLTVRDIVAMGRTPYKRAFAGENTHDVELITDALRRVDMLAQSDRSFLTLSGGERQRVLLARALAQDPRVLVLDEPTNHLDVQHQVELLRLLREQRRTTLLAIHDLNAAAAVCHRLHVLNAGHLVASGTPAEVLTPRLLREAFGVRATVLRHPDHGGPLLAVDHDTAPAQSAPADRT